MKLLSVLILCFDVIHIIFSCSSVLRKKKKIRRFERDSRGCIYMGDGKYQCRNDKSLFHHRFYQHVTLSTIFVDGYYPVRNRDNGASNRDHRLKWYQVLFSLDRSREAIIYTVKSEGDPIRLLLYIIISILIDPIRRCFYKLMNDANIP